MKYDSDGNLVSVTSTSLSADTNTYENGNLIKTVTGGNGTYTYTYDTTNTHRVTAVTVEGVVKETLGYDASGNVNETTLQSVNGEIAELNPLRYRGYYYDSETGFYYLQSRYYDPVTGRFINADDTEYIGADGSPISYNIFAYCENNPVNRIDTTGHRSCINLLGVVAVVALAAVVVIGTGGTAAPPLLAAGGALAAEATASVAVDVAVTGLITAGVAELIQCFAKPTNGQNKVKDYVQAKGNKQANEWARKVGYENAEELKAAYVSNGTSFNIFLDRATNEILLIGKWGIYVGKEIFTQLFL